MYGRWTSSASDVPRHLLPVQAAAMLLRQPHFGVLVEGPMTLAGAALSPVSTMAAMLGHGAVGWRMMRLHAALTSPRPALLNSNMVPWCSVLNRGSGELVLVWFVRTAECNHACLNDES